MSEEDFDDEPELGEEVDDFDEDLVPEDDVVLEDEIDDDVDVAVELENEEEDGGPGLVAARTRRIKRPDDEDDDVVDLDEELHPDDVEEPLDVLLAERTASERLDEEDLEELEDEEEPEPDDRGDGSTRIVPRRADEFLCSSCFLVLPLTQLADPKRQLCRDCA